MNKLKLAAVIGISDMREHDYEMNEPDYDNFTLAVLKDVASHIDREANSERYEKIVSILNDPVKRLKLDEEHEVLLEGKRVQKVEAIASVGALVIWALGFIVLTFGVVITKRTELHIESMPIRVAIFVGFIILGYKFLIKILSFK